MKLLLLVLALCVAQINALSVGLRPDYTDDYDDDTRSDWQPEPLKPAPWRSGPEDVQPQMEAVVQVPEIGQIEGVRAFKTIANRPVNAFLGLRYGRVGGGLARFQAAQPTGFQGRVNATVQSPNCAQFPELDRLRSSESHGENVDDCLTLDIYAPEGANQLPVMVFVHGEMLFDGGSEEAQPDYILENDVLLVSINYRLAPFGFLSALTDELPGNVALSDLHLALRWLQRNLVFFGGNPEKVTLVGQAGGATLVHALSLSGRASNLFQQLILQSGTALNPYLIDNQPLDTLNTFARLARCPPANPNSRALKPLYDCLGRMPTSQLVAAFEQLLLQNERLGLTQLGGFKLVVGDPLGYLPSHPASLVTNSSRALPMIVGATKDASAFIISRVYDQISHLQSHNVSDYIDVVLRHTAPPSEHRMWKQWALREIFNPDQEYTASLQTVANGLLELSNYILYRAPVINSIRHSYRSTPAYLYIFDYRGEHHRFGHLSNPLPFGVDASLSDDSVYLFPYPPEASRLNFLDRSLSRNLVSMWVDFVITGVPNSNSGVWPQATSEYGPFLRFTNSRQKALDLDPHFGEGIYLPNQGWVSFRPVNNTTPIATTTTTTTTSRPYVYNPYANWQNRPIQHQPNWHPADPEYVRAQEARQQQFIREREQRRREQQQRDNQLRPHPESRDQREQQERLRQQREQEERLRQQREQEERVRQQREQEERVRQQREQEEQVRQQREQEERVRQQREREQYEREQQELQEREERERDQPREGQQNEYSPEREDNPWGYPEDDQQQRERQREQQEREQQEREQQEREQQEREREQQMREQQEREQQEREQQEREQQEREEQEREPQEQDKPEREEQEREQREREQREREQQEREEWERERQEREQQERDQHNDNDGRLPYPTYEQYGEDDHENPSGSDYNRHYNEEQEREQQQQEQLRREQQEQQEREERMQREREQQERDRDDEPKDNPEDFPSYEEYIKAQEAKNAERDRYYAEEQERERQQQEQLHQERQQHPEEPQPDERQSYPSFESYDSDRNNAEEREREQQRRDQVEQERQQQPGEDHGEEYGRSQEEEGEEDVLKVEDFDTYEAYLEAANKLREKQEEQERLEEDRYRAEQEEEDRIQAERERNSQYA